MNSDQLLFEAKSKAIELMENYTPPQYRKDLKLQALEEGLQWQWH